MVRWRYGVMSRCCCMLLVFACLLRCLLLLSSCCRCCCCSSLCWLQCSFRLCLFPHICCCSICRRHAGQQGPQEEDVLHQRQGAQHDAPAPQEAQHQRRVCGGGHQVQVRLVLVWSHRMSGVCCAALHLHLTKSCWSSSGVAS